MHPSPSSYSRAARAVLIALAMAGCAAGRGRVGAPAPDEIPQLEAAVAQDTTDLDAVVLLGAAYREAGRLEDARELLERAVQRRPDDASARAFLGLTYEDLERFGDARRQYEAYIERGDDDELRDVLEHRLEILRHKELRQAVRDALRREAELAGTDPAPRTVAVFPFEYAGEDARYRPLGRALAELLVTDLGQSDRLTVLERLRVQALLDELELSRAGLVDPATAARSGRLLGAGRIVQGRLDVREALATVDGALVSVPADDERPFMPISREERLERLLDMEKRLVLDVFLAMGISLTPAERERVEERPTDNIQALLAFGRALEAADAGDYAAAAAAYNEAARIDPGFALARRRAERARRTATAARASPTRLAAQRPRLDRRRARIRAGRRLLRRDRHALRRLLSRHQVRPSAIAEVLGRDRLGNLTILEIIYRVR